MTNFFESDSNTEELGFPNAVLPYQWYEPAPNQSKLGEPISSSDVSEDEEAGLDEDNSWRWELVSFWVAERDF